MQPDEIAARIREFEALCRRRGVALTVQRRVIFEAVLEREDHPTADQVVEVVKERIRGVSRTTVYRVLDTLVDLGVVRRLDHPGPAVRYDGKVRRHHHLICTQCFKVVDLDDARLDRLRPPDVAAEGFEIEDFSVHFLGLCSQCRKNK
jgi:Fur family peroxide stress response transcriptional regulator